MQGEQNSQTQEAQGQMPETEGFFTQEAPMDYPEESVDGMDLPQEAITWTASEFIAHTKSPSWYVVLAAGSVVAAFAAYLLTQDLVLSLIMPIAGAMFGVVASRQPRELTYVIDGDGIRVADKLYQFSKYKSFSIVQEEGVQSIWFMPLQRFDPGLSVYFAPDDINKIVEALSFHLPLEPREMFLVDKLMHKLRF